MNTLLEAANPSPGAARTTLVRSSGPQSWRDKPDDALHRDALRLLGQLRENATAARPVWENFFDAALGDSVGSPHTRRSYQQGAWTFLQWALSGEGGVDLLRPARRDGQRYLGWLRSHRPGQPYRPATLQVRIVAARAVMSALRWAGLGEARDPFGGVRVRAGATPSIVSRPPYGDPELAALRTLAESLDPEDRRLWVLTLLCLHAGLRVAEALALTPEQIKGGGRFLRLTGKGSKMRQVPLSQQLITELSMLSAPDGRYFAWSYNDVTYRMKGVMANSGLIWRGFHGLRKACATRLYEATGDFTRVGLFLGHASADTTRRYVAVRADDLSRYVDGWNENTY